MKLALLTSAELPHGDADDGYLIEALQKYRIDLDWLVWDQIEQPFNYDLALIRSVWDYHTKAQAFNAAISQLSQQMPVLNPYRVVHWNSDKTYLKDLQQAGLPLADTHWINQMPSATEFQRYLCNIEVNRWFLKPVVGADASGTLVFKTDREGIQRALYHLKYHLSHSAMMLQPFLQSVGEEGELSVIYIGGQLTHAVIKLPQAGDYRVQDTFGGTDFPYQLQPAERHLAEQCMAYLWQRFGSLCYARLDFLRDLCGQWVLNEVELIEPSLFFRHNPKAAEFLVKYFI